MKQQLIILKKMPKEPYRRAYRIIDVSSEAFGTREYGRLVGLNTNVVQGADFKKGDIIEPTGSGRKYKCIISGACFFFTINHPLSANRD